MEYVDKTTLFGEFESHALPPSGHTQLYQAPRARREKEAAGPADLETEVLEKTLKLRIIQVSSSMKIFNSMSEGVGD